MTVASVTDRLIRAALHPLPTSGLPNLFLLSPTPTRHPTAWRYATETVDLLPRPVAEAAEGRRDAKRGHAYVVVDGTLIAIDPGRRGPVALPRHKHHGMNLQVISSPRGEILWVSGPLPGSVHDAWLLARRITEKRTGPFTGGEPCADFHGR